MRVWLQPRKDLHGWMSVCVNYFRSYGAIGQYEGFPGGTEVKNPPANAGRPKRHRINPWVRKIPGGEHGNALQYSCLENPMDRGAYRVTVHRVAKTRTWLKQLNMHAWDDTTTPSTVIEDLRYQKTVYFQALKLKCETDECENNSPYSLQAAKINIYL